jgi:biotin carboxyl carrier protein
MTGETVARSVDPRAVRATAPDNGSGSAPRPIVLEPAGVPGRPQRVPGVPDRSVLVDGSPTTARLERLDATHVTLIEDGDRPRRTSLIMLADEPTSGRSLGVRRVVAVVDGWQVEVEVESERLADLRARARRGDEGLAHRGPTEVRAIIPGRIGTVSVVPGDTVVLGQPLLVIEAMKMQNELRAPRDGVVSSVAVGSGQTIEVGDLLLALQ